ncbi:hypothetical protein K435DRAFT_889218 [Dendrothele bispora CBS 962.96]|uniref:DUF659 domain-containing protein n=1 Tax=Dendrothele bispora (strain CBS 962.96) TaxID=1314807 RepID=A0A4S8KRW2_DENBC|nr:hypothetical protein K435DRAFT_889218 [Dendrothele bispora CBS 962.96]
MAGMGVRDGKNFIAITTDNLTTMISFWRKIETVFPWVITLVCFLHQMNTCIGEICIYAPMKKIISQCSRIVKFFNGSHYTLGAKTCLKTNCESHWYALILHTVSAKSSCSPLQTICCCPDATGEQKTGYLL